MRIILVSGGLSDMKNHIIQKYLHAQILKSKE